MGTSPQDCTHCDGKVYGCPRCSFINPEPGPQSSVESAYRTLVDKIENETAQRIASFFDGDSDGWIQEIILSGRWKHP